MEVWYTSNLRPLRLGDEKKTERKKPQHENIMVCSIIYGDHEKKEEEELECGLIPNVMAALLNVSGALS